MELCSSLIDEEKPAPGAAPAANFYEFLQISPHAKPETIHRIYRFLAARYHPDNKLTGDLEKFLLLNQAYEVLSDPERRAECDTGAKKRAASGSRFRIRRFYRRNRRRDQPAACSYCRSFIGNAALMSTPSMSPCSISKPKSAYLANTWISPSGISEARNM